LTGDPSAATSTMAHVSMPYGGQNDRLNPDNVRSAPLLRASTDLDMGRSLTLSRTTGEESGVQGLGKFKKFNTMCAISKKGRQDWSLSPEALQKLHERHEEKKTKSRKTKTDTSFVALKRAFGKRGSWLLHAKLPDEKRERHFVKRHPSFWGNITLKSGVLPGNEAEYLLSHWGAAMLNTKGLKSDPSGRPDSSIRGQDNCSVATLEDGWEIFCVMDGHGKDGDWVSTRAVTTMPFYLQRSYCALMLSTRSANGFQAALTSAFHMVEKDLEDRAQEENINIEWSGSTATVAIRDKENNDLWVATVGDSSAVLLVPGEGIAYSTKDHKPSDELEVQRLEENGACVERTEYEDGDVEERVFVKGEVYPGLGMTRSLGDVCVKAHGVIATPEVVRWPIIWKTSYYLACSDGVWEFLPKEEVADIVLKQLEAGKTCGEIVEGLLDKAKRKWLEYDSTYVDDITLLLVPLDDSTRPGTLMTHFRVAGECMAGCQRDCNLM